MTEVTGSFNLVDSPWIPVLRHDGRLEEVSISDAFRYSREFTQLGGEVPTQVFALQRLLLAILHRATEGPIDVKHWRMLRDNWEHVISRADQYLATFRDRFFLFHPTKPFFQTADLRTARDETSGLERLIADVPNGAPFFTTRIGPGLERISFAEAARWLVHAHAFDPAGIRSGAVGDPRVKSGKVYPIGPGWAGQIGGVLLEGRDLSETLLLNLVAPRELNLLSTEHDVPPWERPQLTPCVETGGARPEPNGLIDLYTWQTRRIRLVRDGEYVVGLVLAQGDRMTPQNRQDIEPMTTWRYSEPQSKKAKADVYMPRTHDAARQFWRGLNGLLPHLSQEASTKGPSRFLVPAVVTWAAILRDSGTIDEARLLTIRAVGIKYGSNLSVIDEIIDDSLVLPAALLGDDAAALELVAVDGVERAEAAAAVIGGLARNLAQAAGADVESTGAADRARELFYAALDAPFRQWLTGLSLAETAIQASTRWQRTVRQITVDQAAELLRETGPSSWIGRKVRGRHVDSGKAEIWFRTGLSKALPRGSAEMEEEVVPS